MFLTCRGTSQQIFQTLKFVELKLLIPDPGQPHPLAIADLVMAPDRRQVLDIGLDLRSKI